MGVHHDFTGVDWLVIALYMVFTTWLGHRLSGKQSTIKDFFLGGKRLPWWAVSGSIIATEISALTFIGVPGGVYAMAGDWTYLQWGIGSIIARFAVGYWLVPLYYEKEIYSPYDFMGERLGEGVRRLVTGLFSLGAVLGQGVRVVVTAVILQVMTGLDAHLCIVMICIFAVLWTFLGGMQTVIWTDVIQFGLFIAGGILALIVLVQAMGWQQIHELNQVIIDGKPFDKTRILDLRTPFESPMVSFTLWVGIFAMPFQNVAAFGVDQLSTQRMFCCGSAKDARKAICWSSVSILITYLMLAVGAGLFAWYQVNTPSPDEVELFTQDRNFVFPTWIIRELPMGISGLILAGAFAAAISSLDSILAALSQTSLSILYGRERLEDASSGEKMVFHSRVAVFIWGVILCLFSIGMFEAYSRNPDSDLIKLAFGILAYTFGPLLGILLAAIFPKKIRVRGLMVGAVLSVLIVFYSRPELRLILDSIGLSEASAWLLAHQPGFISVWFFPINCAVTYGCGWLAYQMTRKAS